MRIGILETGAPPRRLTERFGRYDAMMARLIGPGFETASFSLQDGVWPESPDAFAGFLLTGSAAGAYEDLPWIVRLREFLRAARGRTRLIGICFGHQIMADAFGGRVVKSDRGWGLGLQRYRVEARPDWLDGPDTIAVPASHQDQVVAPPPGARVLVSSDFAPLAGLVYDDQPAISFQAHPEFSPDFARALLELGHAKRLPADELASLSASLDGPNDNGRLGVWIGRFLRGEAAGGAEAP